MSCENEYFWGVDPGWKNMGVCVLDKDTKVVFSASVNPSEKGFSDTVLGLPFSEYRPTAISLERYVAYRGKLTADAESILMMIGALVFATKDSDQRLFRAIDWKSNLLKQEVKTRGFQNPSDKMDKKYSMAMATHLTGVKFKTDHEADAACLAYMSKILHRTD